MALSRLPGHLRVHVNGTRGGAIAYLSRGAAVEAKLPRATDLGSYHMARARDAIRLTTRAWWMVKIRSEEVYLRTIKRACRGGPASAISTMRSACHRPPAPGTADVVKKQVP